MKMAQEKGILKFLIKEKKEESKNSNTISQFVEKKLGKQISGPKKSVNDPLTESKDVNDVLKELAAEKQKNKSLLADLKMSMTLVKEASVINLSKDVQIDNLTKQLKKTTLNSQCESKTNECQSQFSEFSGVFSDQQLRKLRSIKSGKTKDSTFILQCVRFLYPDPSVLSDRSVTGKTFNKQKKREMTPTKIHIITKMLNQRLQSEENLSESDAFQRLGRVKRLTKDAIMKLKPSRKNIIAQNGIIEVPIQPTTMNAIHSTSTAVASTTAQAIYSYAYQPLIHYINNSNNNLRNDSMLGNNQITDWPNYAIAVPNYAIPMSIQPQIEQAEANHLK